jgi:hypothetical protein
MELNTVQADQIAGPSVLKTPLFGIEGGDGTSRLSLPALLAHLVAGNGAARLPAVGVEDRPFWWRFLTRTGAHALHQAILDIPRARSIAEEELTALLQEQLDRSAPATAWLLHHSDLGQPAFLQASGMSHDLEPQGLAELSPLVGSKEHDRKTSRLRRLDPEAAVYALVSLQLGAPWGGPGHFPGPFASGGYCGSPFMGALLPGDLQETFRHDLSVLLNRWASIQQESGLRGQTWAVWALPWDGEKDSAVPARSLSPAFVPVARRVRLLPPGQGGYTRLLFQPSKGPRIDDHTGGGFLGDPFTPFVPDGERWKVHRVTRQGYNSREVVRLLFGAGEPAIRSASVEALTRLPSSVPDVAVVFESYAVTQGGTEGYHRRVVPLPAGARRLLETPKPVREVFQAMEDMTRKARGILWAAAGLYLTGALNAEERAAKPEEAALKRSAVRFDAAVEAIRVERLLAFAQRNDLEWQVEWGKELHGLAIKALQQAMREIPARATERLMREVQALHYLNMRLPQVLKTNEQTTVSSADLPETEMVER